MNFWLRNIVLGTILIVLAYLLLANQELLFSLDEQWITEPTSEAESESTETSSKQDKKAPKGQSKNAAAEGLSRFYASLNADLDDKGLKVRNNVVFLPDPKGDLVKILEARRMVTRPYRKNWQGSVQSRPFRIGQTLFQKLSEYASEDGLEVIWWLNRDFLVKDPFRIEKNILKTAYQVGKAVEGHFQNGISIYFCFRQRALVLIEEPIEYLNDECTLLQSKSQY